jgi:uncharacterized protein YbbC (DUF1343 family)
MFSFRTTPLEDQLDKALLEGSVGCFCTQNCWDTAKGRFMDDLFRERGNLSVIFSPEETELSQGTNHISFSEEQISGLDAIVVEIQDVGSRYFNYSEDVFHLMSVMKCLDSSPSLYIVDHMNPAGRVVEGTVPKDDDETFIPKVAHRHGLTLGELCNLYYVEIGARYPLHVISANATDSNKQLLPWTIAPASDFPGMFTCYMYSGGALWNGTSITPAIGTARPYEYIGAPFIKHGKFDVLPVPVGVMMRPCSFTPSFGRYACEKCYGYQIMLEPGAEYHSLIHTLQLMKFFAGRYSQFELYEDFYKKLDDSSLVSFIEGGMNFPQLKEYIKVEEQKWIRKAKRYTLYDVQPFRIK